MTKVKLDEFQPYIDNNSADGFQSMEKNSGIRNTITRAFVESMVNDVVAKRMAKKTVIAMASRRRT